MWAARRHHHHHLTSTRVGQLARLHPVHAHLGQHPAARVLVPERFALNALEVGVVGVLANGGLKPLENLLEQLQLLVLFANGLQVVEPIQLELAL